MPKQHVQQDAVAEKLLASLPAKRTGLGLRRPVRYSATLLSDLVTMVRALGDGAETPRARAAVEAVLRSPFWGLRWPAVAVLGRWGGPRNKEWLMTRAAPGPLGPRRTWDKQTRWRALQSEAARAAVAPLLEPDDAAWMLDQWFDDWLRFGGLHRAAHLIADAAVAERVAREMSSDDTARRTAALWLVYGRRSMPERAGLMRRLASDADAVISSQARKMIRWDAC